MVIFCAHGISYAGFVFFCLYIFLISPSFSALGGLHTLSWATSFLTAVINVLHHCNFDMINCLISEASACLKNSMQFE